MVTTVDVFVYGTLKPGETNYAICANRVITVRRAIAYGHLYALPFGYPAMTPGTDIVQGNVLSFANADIFAILDEFERHEPETFYQYMPDFAIDRFQYKRQKIAAYDIAHHLLGVACSYVMTIEQVHLLNGVLIPDGQWGQQLSNV